MAFNPAPTVLLGSQYNGSSTDAVLKIADFPKLTSAEAEETTGDSRKLLFAVLDEIANKYEALAPADRPAKMTLTRGYGSVSGGQTRVTFSFVFNLDVGALEVSAE
jgi:hypothetical protein